MMGFIQKLQKKPEPERRRILLVTSIGLTLVVVLIWLSGFYLSSINKNDAGTDPASPFEGLKAIFQEAKERFNLK